MSRWPSVAFENTDPPVRMQVWQSRWESDWGAHVSSTTLFERGKTYDVRITCVESLLSIYVNGVFENSIQSTTYVPAGSGQLYVGSPWYPAAGAKISNARISKIDDLYDASIWDPN